MRIALIGFFCGVFAASFLSDLPDILQLSWLLLALPLGLLARRFRWPLFVLSVLVGSAWLVLYVFWFGPAALPDALEGEPFDVNGRIASVPECNGRRCRFDFEVMEALSGEADWKGRVRISWYYPETVLKAGQQWRLRLKLKRPRGFANPGGFDYESWLFQQGIAANGYVRQPEQARLLSQKTTLNSIRQELGQRLRKQIGEDDLSGLIVALTTGDRQFIDAEQWRVLSRTGTVHLMAISGLHVGLLYGLFYWLGRFAWSLSARLCLYRPAQDIAVISGLLAACVYAALAGFAVPTQRALIMLLVIGLNLLLRRISSPIDVLLLALAAVLCLDPLAVLSPGFWLSFAAVAVIFAVISPGSGDASRRIPWLRRLVVIQFAIAVGLMPFLVVFFHQVSLVAPLANLFAVPWVSVLVVPLSLAGAVLTGVWPVAAELVLQLAMQSVQVMWLVLEPASETPFAARHIAQPDLWAVILAGTAVIGLLVIRHRWWRLAGLPLVLPLIMASAKAPDTGAFWVDVLDVGQGLSVVVRTANHRLLFDTGFSSGKSFDIGQRVILPYLWHEGIDSLDRLIVSHDDKDHAGGMHSLLSEFQVENLLLTPGSKYVLNYPDAGECLAGQRWQWDGVVFEILHPDGPNWRKDNNRSCVLRISSDSGSVLISADIEDRVERELVRRYGDALHSTVLLVPHHGSLTSSGAGFIDAVRPEVAIYPVGYRNRFKLPHPEVVARYSRRQIQQYRSDESGMLRMAFPAQGRPRPVSEYRHENRRFWRHAPQR